jgi:hypothetical protein
VHPVWARRKASRSLPGAVFRTYLLWALGEPGEVAAGSPKTLQRHDQIIGSKLGLSIRQPASAVLGRKLSVDPAAIFARKNRVLADTVDLDQDLGSLGEHLLETN